MTDSGTAPTQRQRLKAIIGGSTGNLVEWYDWYAYAAFTLYFAPHFFPSEDRTAQLLSAAGIFAVGFLMRPIGAWLMGVYADRHGRKSGLTLSVALMCAGSLLIGVTPGYETIGVAAPLLLVLARLMQGLSIGGEYGASATYLSEMAGRSRRGFFSSFQYVTLIAGQLVAICVLLLLQATLTEAQLDAWGWRIPFFIGGALAIIVFWLRRGLAETQSFANARAEGGPRSGFVELITRHPRETLTVMLLTAGGTIAFYAYSIYMQKFLVNTSGLSREAASQAVKDLSIKCRDGELATIKKIDLRNVTLTHPRGLDDIIFHLEFQSRGRHEKFGSAFNRSRTWSGTWILGAKLV